MSDSKTNNQPENREAAKSLAPGSATIHSHLTTPRSLRFPKPVRAIFIAIVLVAAVSVAIYAARRAWPSGSSDIAPLVVPIQTRDFTLKIYADGELQSSESM